MSVIINGKRYVAAWLNGKRYDKGYFNGKLVLVTPDNNAYLMAADGVHLRVNNADLLAFDIVPQVQNNLPQLLGSEPFAISVDVHRDLIGKGLCYLFDWAGMIDCKSQDETLAFRFNWEENPVWKFVPKEVIQDGWNKILLTGDGETKIELKVNSYSFTIFGTVPFKNPIHYPVENDYDRAILNEILSSGTWQDTGTDIRNIKVADASGTAYAHFVYTPSKDCVLSVKATVSSENNYDYGGIYIGTAEYKATQGQIKNMTVASDGGSWLVAGSGTTLKLGPNATLNNGYFETNLISGTQYVVSFCYAKDGSGSSGSDALMIQSFFTGTGSEPYPTLSAGVLIVRQDWSKLNNFKAVTIGE